MNRSVPRAAPAALAVLVAAGSLAAGPLNPPAGPVSPTPGPEPRTAINAINTPGDGASAYRITQPGSYYLAGNLGGESGKFGIVVAASGVSIDLNGFSFTGVPGSADGIVVLAGGITDVEVRNGSVSNWGEDGIDFDFSSSDACRVVDVRATGNGLTGIRLANSSTAVRCNAYGNHQGGIAVQQGCTVCECTVGVNAGDGIFAGLGCTVTSCTIYGNGGDGVEATSSCTVSGCSVYNNDGVGVSAFSAGTISGNSVRSSGLHGISVSSGCLVFNNTCSGNGQKTTVGAGVHMVSADNRVEGNNCIGQDLGIHAAGFRNLIIRNSCSGNGTNWEIVGNNVYGPIVDRASAVTAPASGNAAASTLNSTDANANYTY